MHGKLFLKIFGSYLVIAAIAIGVVGFLVGNQIREKLDRQIEAELFAYARIVELAPVREVAQRAEEIARITLARVTVIDRDGTVIAETDRDALAIGSHFDRPEIQEARVRGKGTAVRYSQTVGEEMKYVALPIRKGDQIAGYIRLARPLVEVRRSVEAFTGILLRSFLVILALSVAAALFFSRRLTAPIREMERFTERLRRGEAPGTLLIRTPDEIGLLAENINYIVEELQKRIDALQEEKAKVEAAFSSAMDGVLLLGIDGKIETLNQGMRSLIGERYGEIAGKTPLEAFRNLDLQKALDQHRASGRPVSQEIVFGEEPPHVFDVAISGVRGVSGSEGKTLLVFHDVTRLKKLERMRVDFVANVTHEIKTPLTAILGFVETLQEGAIEDRETARKFLGTIARHAERLNRLVEDLLTISNIELGEMRFCFESVALSGIVQSVMHILHVKAQEKRIDLAAEIPDGLPPIRADRDRLSQILINVLDNAVKFTPEGGRVRLSAAAAGDEVLLRIADTGIGVPRDEIGRLGERFYRVDKTRSRELGGTGLGLSIVKHLMAAHRGRLEIESQLGRGTTVSLYFPVFRDASS